jgi:carboxymethylenebutenolidase
MGTLIKVDEVTVYRAEPESASPRAGLVMIHEIWGLVDHARDVAERFAAEGYLVYAPDLLSKAGTTPVLGEKLQALQGEPEERRLAYQPQLRAAFAPINNPDFAAATRVELKKVVDALVADLPGGTPIGVVGFCFGGNYSFDLAAHDPRISVAVPFYGRAPEASDIATIGCPVLGIYGENDGPLMETLPQLEAEFAAAGKDFTAKVYPDAGHAFFNDRNKSSYRAEQAKDAWRVTLDFLAEHLGGAPSPTSAQRRQENLR